MKQSSTWNISSLRLKGKVSALPSGSESVREGRNSKWWWWWWYGNGDRVGGSGGEHKGE